MGERDGGRRATPPIFRLFRDPADNAFVSPSFSAALFGRLSHSLAAHQFHLPSLPLHSRRLSPPLLPRQASVGGGWRQTGSAVRPWRRCCCRSPVSRDGHNNVSSRPTPIHVVRNRDGVGSMLNLSAISLLVNMESYRKNNL